jgi:hypothetical protein
LAQGKENVKKLLEDNPEFAAEIEAKVREMSRGGIINEEDFELEDDDDFDIRTIEDDE